MWIQFSSSFLYLNSCFPRFEKNLHGRQVISLQIIWRFPFQVNWVCLLSSQGWFVQSHCCRQTSGTLSTGEDIGTANEAMSSLESTVKFNFTKFFILLKLIICLNFLVDFLYIVVQLRTITLVPLRYWVHLSELSIFLVLLWFCIKHS